ncbi:MAG: response regulator, partial [Bacteroidales bacterium]|nr:response regulator [Bacteroidales bacterium]
LIYIVYAYKKRLKAEALYKLEKQSHEHEQDLNNERLRFYTNITHELRTPLTLIVGPLEDLQKSNSLSTKDAQKISVIRQSAIRLLNLINQILEFRKTETQNRKLCVSRADLATLIRENGLKYKELNRKKEVEIRWEIEPEQAILYFDREIIQIILDNLISNALKYTDKGSITIGLHNICSNNLKYTEMSVCDTGYGISSEAIPHIFDRYYQEGSRHQASGTGIGLALVKNLIDLHEGEIEVESTPNQGSIFRVRLLTDNSYPNALHAEPTEKTSIPSANESTEHETGTRPILLVVEDNPDIRDYVASSFSDDFDVRTADNGKQGMELALKEIPDIIVSDIMMPIMDGNEMCRELKKDVRTSHIPIILLTAKDSLADKEEGYQTGADSYLTKPFSASLLHSRIENLLQSRKQLAEHFSNHNIANDKSTIMAESMSKLDNEFIQKIDLLIKERLSTDKIDIGYLADKMCMSNSTLYRKMKALTGLSTNEYIRKARMKYAEQYLLEGKYTISEIAFKVGINNLFYFRQCFKEEFGCIPSEYLKKLKNEL